jgi:hypothetical protein
LLEPSRSSCDVQRLETDELHELGWLEPLEPMLTKRTLHQQETQAVIRLYEARGLTVSRVEGDREFTCIENELLPTSLNVTDADDHVAQVERSIRTIKERVRCLLVQFPRIGPNTARQTLDTEGNSIKSNLTVTVPISHPSTIPFVLATTLVETFLHGGSYTKTTQVPI